MDRARNSVSARRYHEKHREVITADAPSLDGLEVVVDLGNRTGGVVIDALLDLGCSIQTLNAQPDGRFPARPSEPNEETLSMLMDVVGATDADLGVALDGDSDRLMAVDETGSFAKRCPFCIIRTRRSE